MYVHGRCEAGEAIERGREGKNKVKFGLDWIGMSARVCGWRGVAWRVMSVRAFLVLVLGSWSWFSFLVLGPGSSACGV